MAAVARMSVAVVPVLRDEAAAVAVAGTDDSAASLNARIAAAAVAAAAWVVVPQLGSLKVLSPLEASYEFVRI